MKRSVVFLMLFALACSTAAPLLQIQPGPRGTISGIVTLDEAPLPGATITVFANDRGSKAAVSDASGRFFIGGLAPGRYSVTVTLAGLQPMQRSVDITELEGATVNARMRLSGVSEAITVTAEAPNNEPGTTTIAGANTLPVAPRRTKSTRKEEEPQITLAASMTGANPVPAPVPPPPPIAFDSITEAAIGPQYAPIAEHDFIDTATQDTTTFAIDVDTASYTNIRRYLTDGQRPPVDAVRIEEMINYFRYNDPQPRDGTPFSVTTEVAGCPWNVQNRLVRIGLQGLAIDKWSAAPNNLVFLIDVSGSMDRPISLPLLQASFRLLIDELRTEDRVAIVVYAGAAGLVLPSTSGANKAEIRAAIDRLQAGGATAGGQGIELAYKVAQENFIEHGNNRIILATDGDFNVGISSIEELQNFIEQKRRTGVFLSVVGVGVGNYKDAKMEALADKGNGNFFYLDTLKEAEKVFKRDLTGTLVTIAKDVKVQVEFDPAYVASYRQIGYENRALANKDFEDDTKDAGELGSGHHVTALYEIVPRANGRTIGQVRLRYKLPAGETSTPLAATTIVDEGRSAYDASEDMRLAAAVAEFGMLLRDSPHKGTASWDDAAQLARLSIGADLDGTREELARLVESGRLLSNPKVTSK